MDLQAFYRAVLAQDAHALRGFFQPDAWVEWPCSNERFTVEEYIRANCEYPGEWDGEIEQAIQCENEIAAAAHVYLRDQSASFHAAAFIRLKEGKIASMVEYWGDDGSAPAWRREMRIGRPIR